MAILTTESGYAKRRQEHVALINQLRAIGAQADLDLPRVAVIGNQSAGKSSLVEAISGITVPRDAGTCTRCPIECRMANSTKPWSCKVSIRREFLKDDSRSNEVRETAFGPSMSNKGDVELTLRRAQAAVLNPDKDPQEFVTMSAKELKHLGRNQLQFSRNAVCVDLSGPDLTDLAFIDLPGIIQNAQPDIVSLVEEVVLAHIEGNCIILVTLPMSDDIENQKAMQLAKQVDPSGVRTIGVLTKPDTVPSGAIKAKELWLDVIEGRRFPLKLGYFCTRQPDEYERMTNVTPEQSRASESNFFQSTAPWSTSTHQHRFGTFNLITSLSTHLTHVIDSSLPKIHEEVTRQLQVCDTHLGALPPPPTSEPFAAVLGLLNSFESKMRSYIVGNLETASLVQSNRTSYAAFQTHIRNTAPLFVPYEVSAKPSSTIDELDRLEAWEDLRTNSKTPQITLKAVRQRIDNATTRELPNNVPYAAKLSLIKDFQCSWPAIAQAVTEQVSQSLRDVIQVCIKVYFSQYKHLELQVRDVVETLLQAKYNNTVSLVCKILKYESTAFTQNNHYLSDATAKLLGQYKEIRSSVDLRSDDGSPYLAKTTTDAIIEDNTATTSDSELRLSDYQEGRKSSTANPAALLFDFGSLASIGGGLFGYPSTTPSAIQLAANVTDVVVRPTLSSVRLQARKSRRLPRIASPRQPPAVSMHSSAPQTDVEKEQTGSNNPPSTSSQLLAASLLGSPVPGASQTVSSALPKTAPTSSVAPFSFAKAPPAQSPVSSSFSPPQHGASSLPFSLRPSEPPGPSGAAHAVNELTAEERKHEEEIILESLRKLGYTGVQPSDFGKLLPSDEYEEEMALMAEVRAYFKVAYKRIIDYIPLVIDHELLFAFSEDLQTHLIDSLGMGSDSASAKCASYLAEDPDTAAKREEVLAKKKRLLTVLDELRTVGT